MVDNQTDSRAGIKVSDPFKYSGLDKSKLENWLFQLRLVFNGSPRKFRSDSARVNYATSYLADPAQQWFKNLIQNDELNWMNDWTLFEQELRNHWGIDDPEGAAEDALTALEKSGKLAPLLQ